MLNSHLELALMPKPAHSSQFEHVSEEKEVLSTELLVALVGFHSAQSSVPFLLGTTVRLPTWSLDAHVRRLIGGHTFAYECGF